jgi:hypothetical protein
VVKIQIDHEYYVAILHALYILLRVEYLANTILAQLSPSSLDLKCGYTYYVDIVSQKLFVFIAIKPNMCFINVKLFQLVLIDRHIFT